MKYLVLGLSLLGVPVQAGQPISESLVECAALYDISNRQEPHRATTPDGRALQRVSEMLLTEAIAAARQEGRGDPASYVKTTLAAKEQGWDAKGRFYVLSDEARDWFTYCRKLSRHRGVDIAAARDGG